MTQISQWNSRRRQALMALVLAAVTLGVFGRTLWHDFVNFDDRAYVIQNRHVRQGLSLESVRWALTAVVVSNWHPLTMLSHMADWQCFGAWAGGHHLSSVLMHCASVVLLSILLERWTGAMWRSAAVAGIFAWHPLHVESVAWIAERKDVLSALMGFVALWSYTSYVRAPTWRRYVVVCVVLALSLLSKPMLVTLPALMLLLDYWPLGRTGTIDDHLGLPRRSSRQLVFEKLPLVALAAASAAVTLTVQQTAGAVRALETIPLGNRVANAIDTYIKYIAQTLVPTRLAVFYPHPMENIARLDVAAGAIGLVAVSVFVVRAARRRPYLPVGWFWYLGTLVPVIGLVQVGDQARADRYTYFPLVGLAIALVWWAGDAVAAHAHARRATAIGATAILGALAYLAWQQVGVWRNSGTLFAHAVAVTTRNRTAHYNLGLHLAELGHTPEAIEQYQAALAVDEKSAAAHNNLGLAYLRMGDAAQAAVHHRRAIELEHDNAAAHNNLGLALMRLEDVEGAIAAYRAALALGPRNPQAQYNIAVALGLRGQSDEAVDHLRAAVEIYPDFVAAHYSLARFLARSERPAEAVPHFLRVLQLRPTFGEAHNQLGLVLLDLGEADRAEHHFQEALRLNPAASHARDNLDRARRQNRNRS